MCLKGVSGEPMPFLTGHVSEKKPTALRREPILRIDARIPLEIYERVSSSLRMGLRSPSQNRHGLEKTGMGGSTFEW